MYVFKSAQWLQLVTSWSLAFVRFTFTLHNTTRRLILGLQFLAFLNRPEVDHQLGAVFDPGREVFVERDVAQGLDR